MRKRFLYYIPREVCNKETLKGFGIYDRFLEGAIMGPWTARKWNSGPDNKNGILVASGEHLPEYKPEIQTWMDAGGYWVGTEIDQTMPSSFDLARSVQVSGYLSRMGDGNQWLVPRVWKWNSIKSEHQLSVPHLWNPKFKDGKPSYEIEVIEAFLPLIKIAEKVWASYIDQKPIPMEEACADVAMLLGVNYKIGAAEIGLLGLIDDKSVYVALAAVVDMPAIQEHSHRVLSNGLIKGEQSEDIDEMKAYGAMFGTVPKIEEENLESDALLDPDPEQSRSLE